MMLRKSVNPMIFVIIHPALTKELELMIRSNNTIIKQYLLSGGMKMSGIEAAHLSVT